ncbi:MAG TPA: phosphatase PAP2 family protein [Solirubrobacteraceae bacterium]|nr:phosphatase PAP2 family protein [Solirubrobacteraceae bacterium]
MFTSTRERLAPLLDRYGPRRAPRGTRRTWLDILVVVWLAWVYDAINNLPSVRQAAAYRHGRLLYSIEHTLHLDPEHAINHWLAAHWTLAHVVVWYYNNVHGLMTFGMIGVLWWLRPQLLRELRPALIMLNLVAMAVFWAYPTASPRMLVSHGYVDLTAAVAHLPVWTAGATARYANQLQSFPSLHIAWAVWVSIAAWRLTRRRWLRAAAVIYPFITTFAVMATANHFLLDAIGGALLTFACVPPADRLMRAVRAWSARRVALGPAPG